MNYENSDSERFIVARLPSGDRVLCVTLADALRQLREVNPTCLLHEIRCYVARILEAGKIDAYLDRRSTKCRTPASANASASSSDSDSHPPVLKMIG
jgi:hypothetical protein